MPWITISKPTGSSYNNTAKPADGGTIGVGYYMGPIGLTYSQQIILTDWVDVARPTGSTYTNITKPID